MDDKQMLELAAKAAGLVIRDSNRWPDTIVRRVTLDDGSLNWVRWAPLTDDGDALRLAVTLMIPIQYPDWQRVTRTWGPVGHGEPFDEPHDRDPYAATRRAIVRAAAAIGEAMP